MGRHRRLVDALRLADTEKGILAGVSNTDFLEAVSLLYTRDRRRTTVKEGKELPAVSGNRQALLDLPLEAYIRYKTQVEAGFVRAAKFLHMLRLGARGQPGKAVPMVLERRLRRAVRLDCRVPDRPRLRQVPDWLRGGKAPSTVSDMIFRADLLKTMRMRLSAA